MKDTGLRAYWMTEKQADKHCRLCYNIPPTSGPGWTPYRILVMSNYGSMSYKAFVKAKEFRQWLSGMGYTARVVGRFAEHGIGNRSINIYSN